MRKIATISLLLLMIFSWSLSDVARIPYLNIPYPVQPVSAAAPAFQSFGGIASATSGDITVTLPAHATDDVLLMMVWVRSNAETIPDPSGWTIITGAPFTRGTSTRYWLWWKRATSGAETNPLIDTDGTTANIYGAAINFRGAITSGNPWEVVGTATTGTTDPAVITGITTLTAESLVVAAVGGEDDNNASIITTGTDPAAYTEHYVETNVGTDAVITFSEAERTTAGATGNVSVNWNVAVPVGWGGMVLALKPAPVPTATPTLTPTPTPSADSTFTQTTYRWYVDNDSANPTDPWSSTTGVNLAENTDIALTPASYDPPHNSQELRLRVNLTVNTTNLNTSQKQFSLQYKEGTDSSCTTGSWTTITTGQSWAYATSSVTDGADITEVLSTTTSGKGEEYVKADPSQTNHVAATTTQVIEYDFHIVGTSSTAATQYSFRAIESDGTVLDGYTNCPTLITQPGNADLMRHGATLIGGLKSGFTWAD
jgi:hypothetical protein